MTLDDLLDNLLTRLPALGPWALRGPTRVVRNGRGDCPLQAAARAAGMRPTRRRRGEADAPVPVPRLAGVLGLPEPLAWDLADAADGLADVLARLGHRGGDVERVRRLRVRLLAACGLA